MLKRLIEEIWYMNTICEWPEQIQYMFCLHPFFVFPSSSLNFLRNMTMWFKFTALLVSFVSMLPSYHMHNTQWGQIIKNIHCWIIHVLVFLCKPGPNNKVTWFHSKLNIYGHSLHKSLCMCIQLYGQTFHILPIRGYRGDSVLWLVWEAPITEYAKTNCSSIWHTIILNCKLYNRNRGWDKSREKERKKKRRGKTKIKRCNPAWLLH